jgi:type IV secretion system protein VirD4
LPDHEAIHPEESRLPAEFAGLEDEPDDDAVCARALHRSFRAVARQAALDPADGLGL